MARFRLTKAHVVQGRKLKAGTILCDGTSCSAGDVIWTGLNAASVSPDMSPIDAGATTILNASRFANAPVSTPDGVNSID